MNNVMKKHMPNRGDNRRDMHKQPEKKLKIYRDTSEK